MALFSTVTLGKAVDSGIIPLFATEYRIISPSTVLRFDSRGNVEYLEAIVPSDNCLLFVRGSDGVNYFTQDGENFEPAFEPAVDYNWDDKREIEQVFISKHNDLSTWIRKIPAPGTGTPFIFLWEVNGFDSTESTFTTYNALIWEDKAIFLDRTRKDSWYPTLPTLETACLVLGLNRSALATVVGGEVIPGSYEESSIIAAGIPIAILKPCYGGAELVTLTGV